MTDHSARETSANQRLGWQRIAARGCVILFVCWHLAFLVISNAKIKADWIKATFGKYESKLYLDQAWGMFTSPLWRTVPFPGARLHFSNGEAVDLFSSNEPRQLTRFLRIGGWRQRKLEHTVVTQDYSGDYREPLQRRYAQSYAKQWRINHPNDPRLPVRVTFLRRDYSIPNPGQSWPLDPVPTVRELRTFELEPTE